ncbi:MAG: Glutamine transport ATP-binding protein GlnQ [Firmicutes bacterium ADurb.Bin182]|nr:MAG: Glutamine transport ATP-binding protein GlnQ [Firmicutes bacterium ADurb.Bin182]
MKLLEINSISKVFGGLPVIKDISLSVEEGEVLSIIGPSGSGKSTLLRCAVLLEEIDSGSISYKGYSMIRTDESGRAVRADIQLLKKIRGFFGLVFQNFNLFPHFSVLKNITEPLTVTAGFTKKEAEESAVNLLSRMGLSDKSEAYPYQLSGGQQQRVAIARALALKPEILFFDEPTSSLDPELTGDILNVIKELADDRMTMVIVTHEMNFARDVSDNIIFMNEGEIVEQGAAKELINNPRHERTKQFLKRYSYRI